MRNDLNVDLVFTILTSIENRLQMSEIQNSESID